MKSCPGHAVAFLLISILMPGAASSSRGQGATDTTAPASAPMPAATSTAEAALTPSQPASSAASGDIKVISDAGSLSPTTKPFVHPGIYYNAADLAFMRQKLASHAEPWFSAWEKNKPNAADDNWKPHAVADWDATRDFYMGGDPLVAHKEALQWALTGNPANAAKAIEILNAWSSTLQNIPTHTMPQERLACGANVAQLANAAELLCYGSPDGKPSGWADADIQQFKKMLQIYYAAMQDMMPGYNGNWDALMMDSMICSAVFLDDHDMFDRVLKHYVEGVKPNGGVVNYIFPSGQCQESGRDQGHVQWGLGNLVAICEVAWKQGVDIYGAYNNLLMTGLEYTANYNLGGDVPYEQHPGLQPKISEKGRGIFAPIWEAPYQHYVYRRGLEMPYTKQIIFGTNIKTGKGPAGPYRPEGAFTVGIDWGTFTMFKGDEDPQAVKKP
jgi:hypothetical protein